MHLTPLWFMDGQFSLPDLSVAIHEDRPAQHKHTSVEAVHQGQIDLPTLRKLYII